MKIRVEIVGVDADVSRCKALPYGWTLRSGTQFHDLYAPTGRFVGGFACFFTAIREANALAGSV